MATSVSRSRLIERLNGWMIHWTEWRYADVLSATQDAIVMSFPPSQSIYYLMQEDVNVLGVLGGHDIREERVRSAQETAKRKVAGSYI